MLRLRLQMFAEPAAAGDNGAGENNPDSAANDQNAGAGTDGADKGGDEE